MYNSNRVVRVKQAKAGTVFLEGVACTVISKFSAGTEG